MYFAMKRKESQHVSTYLLKKSLQSNFHEAAFTMMATIVYDTLDVVSQGPQIFGSYEAQPLDTDDQWSYGLHRRKWNNCDGHGNIELPSRFLLRGCLKIEFDTLHFEACHLVIQAMEPRTFCRWTFLWKKNDFQCSISWHFLTTLVVLPYCPLPLQKKHIRTTTDRLYNIPWIYPSNSHNQKHYMFSREPL